MTMGVILFRLRPRTRDREAVGEQTREIQRVSPMQVIPEPQRDNDAYRLESDAECDEGRTDISVKSRDFDGSGGPGLDPQTGYMMA